MTARALAALLTLAACGKESTLEDASCPPGGTSLTYENFARPFLAERCQTCHGKSAAERGGAPLDYDFGTLEQARRHKARIYARAAGDNTTMPPGPDDPPREERDRLAEWLACGAP